MQRHRINQFHLFLLAKINYAGYLGAEKEYKENAEKLDVRQMGN